MKTVRYIFIQFCILFSTFSLHAQELTSFTVANNATLGLEFAGFQKGGLALADIDRNGYPDIFLTRWAEPGYSRIYTNNNGYFTDITDQSPIEQIEAQDSATRTTMWADYDNDGDKDLSMATIDAIHLLRNDDNVFTEVSEEMGFIAPKPGGFIIEWDCNICGWADYDLDGDLDCVVSQLSYDNLYLFRNDGDHFTNVATEAGLDNTPLAEEWRVVFTDFDLDGDPDLVGKSNFLRNDNGVFTNVTEELGFAEIGTCWYKRFFDYDNDGDLDFFKVTARLDSPDFDELWENREGVYYDITLETGLNGMQYPHRGVTFGDADNDGDQDIFLDSGNADNPDIFFANMEISPGVRSFVNVSEFIGITVIGDRKNCGFFDYNRDGFLDIYIPSAEFGHLIYKNDGGNGANWVGFILEGTISNKDAVGSLVTIYTGDKKQIRLTRCGDQHFNQYNPWVHFGIGFATSIDSVTIKWPLGYKQVLKNVDINQYHEITEPNYVSVEYKGDKNIPTSFQLAQNYPNPFNPVNTN